MSTEKELISVLEAQIEAALETLSLLKKQVEEKPSSLAKEVSPLAKIVLRVILMANNDETYFHFVREGKLGVHGTCRYLLYKDICLIAKEIADEGVFRRITPVTVGHIIRKFFEMSSHRTGEGYALVLDDDAIELAKQKYEVLER